MHLGVEVVHAKTNGVRGVDGRAGERNEDRFSWRESLAFLGGECRQLVRRESHDRVGSFKVTGEEASTWVDVGFGVGSSVGPRGGTKGRWETRRCQGWGSWTRSLSEGKKVVSGGTVHLATWCFKI